MKNRINIQIRLRVAVFLLFFSGLLSAAQSIAVWHSFDGPLEEKFTDIVNKFNQKPEIVAANAKIVLHFKGSYDQTLYAGLAAVGTKEAPQILQVFETGNILMQSRPHVYVPLNKLTKNPSALFNNEHFIPFFSTFYKGRHGEKGLHSLPFSASTVILFYNKDAFRKAGLDPEHPPTTWEEFEKMAVVLKKRASKNVLASGRLSGHHIDQLGAWQNQPIATKGNGVDGEKAKLIVNHPFFIHHINKLSNWYQKGILSLDAAQRAEEAFAREEVLILTQGGNRFTRIEKLVNGKFEIGVGYFPYWKSRSKQPQNTVAGGASFWALAGHSAKDYEIVQQFFEYLASPEIQAEWHQDTCYMPVVKGAEAIAQRNQFYEQGLKGKVAKIALNSFSGHKPKEYSRGILLPEFPKVRELMVQEMKEAIKGNKTSEQALSKIVILGNKMMQEGSEH